MVNFLRYEKFIENNFQVWIIWFFRHQKETRITAFGFLPLRFSFSYLKGRRFHIFEDLYRPTYTKHRRVQISIHRSPQRKRLQRQWLSDGIYQIKLRCRRGNVQRCPPFIYLNYHGLTDGREIIFLTPASYSNLLGYPNRYIFLLWVHLCYVSNTCQINQI